MVGLVACGTRNDPLREDFYTKNIYPAIDSTYDIGSSELEWYAGYFNSLYADNITLTGTNPIALSGDALVWLEFRPDLDYETIRAQGAPTRVTRGVFGGFSLPVVGANEILNIEICVPNRWYQPAWQYLQDVGDQPRGMAVYEGALYIPCAGDDNVWVYDGTDFAISGNVGQNPGYTCVYNGNLYVTCNTDDTVWVFNGTTWALSGNVGDQPEGMAVYGGDLYVACEGDDQIWRLNGGVWAIDPAIGLGGVAGAVGTHPRYLAEYGGDLYCGCCGADDDVWIRSAGAWAKDNDVGNDPMELHEYGGDLYLTCYNDDTVWARVGGVWAVVTNIQGTLDNEPVGLEEYNGDLFSACMNSVWSDIEDFWNQNSDFNQVTGDAPMFLKEYDGKLYCSCEDGDGIWVYEGETAWVHIHCWITDAQVNVNDAFRLQLEYENYTVGIDVVPITDDAVIVETVTGIALIHQSYGVSFPLDMTGVENDDNVGIIIDRIASANEIAGEVVIQHIGIIFQCDKLGNPTHE